MLPLQVILLQQGRKFSRRSDHGSRVPGGILEMLRRFSFPVIQDLYRHWTPLVGHLVEGSRSVLATPVLERRRVCSPQSNACINLFDISAGRKTSLIYRTETVVLFQPFCHEFRPRNVEDHPTLFFLHRAKCLRGQQFDATHPLAFLECVRIYGYNLRKFSRITREIAPCTRDP